MHGGPGIPPRARAERRASQAADPRPQSDAVRPRGRRRHERHVPRLCKARHTGPAARPGPRPHAARRRQARGEPAAYNDERHARARPPSRHYLHLLLRGCACPDPAHDIQAHVGVHQPEPAGDRRCAGREHRVDHVHRLSLLPLPPLIPAQRGENDERVQRLLGCLSSELCFLASLGFRCHARL